jgi:5-methylthioribose kinase
VAKSYWDGYGDASIEQNTIRELGCLLLARIDGKSKEDYITQPVEKDAARTLARELILNPPVSLEAVWQRLS